MSSGISLSMIVKNEGNHLSNCLNSVKDVVDEIIIVDTGSTDNTLEIAKSFNAKIFHFEWNDDFSAARNFALSKCSCDWILYLDADEELSEYSKAEVLELIKQRPAAINCTIESKGNKSTLGSIIRYPRLFANKPGVKFEGKVHEQIHNSLKENKIPLINSGIKIIHYGYAIDDKSLKVKKERNLKLMLADKKVSDDFYYKIKIADTLISIGKFDEAKRRILAILDDNRITERQRALVYYFLASVFYQKNDLNQSLKFALKSYKLSTNKPTLTHLIYLIYLREGFFSDALKFLKQTIELNLHLLQNKENYYSENILDQIDLYLRVIILTLKVENKSETQKYLIDLSKFVALKTQVDEQIINRILNTLFIENKCPYEHFHLISEIFSINHLSLVSDIINYNNDSSVKQEVFIQLINIFPESAVLYKNLALLKSVTDKEIAIELLNKALILEPDPAIYMHLISIYLATEDYQKLKETFDNLYKNYSNNINFAPQIKLLKEKLASVLN